MPHEAKTFGSSRYATAFGLPPSRQQGVQPQTDPETKRNVLQSFLRDQEPFKCFEYVFVGPLYRPSNLDEQTVDTRELLQVKNFLNLQVQHLRKLGHTPPRALVDRRCEYEVVWRRRRQLSLHPAAQQFESRHKARKRRQQSSERAHDTSYREPDPLNERSALPSPARFSPAPSSADQDERPSQDDDLGIGSLVGAFKRHILVSDPQPAAEKKRKLASSAEVPWMPLIANIMNAQDDLDAEIRAYAAWFEPSEGEARLRAAILSRVEQAAQACFPGAKAHWFGSSSIDLGLPSADLDINIEQP
ncbi:Poly(A) polymerase [Tilletia horrida]|nr:Poly(A) polymerase [Tilletia horrida]